MSRKPLSRAHRADLVAAALEHGDVEGVDLRLEDHLGVAAPASASPVARKAPSSARRRHLLGEALERPVAAADHLGGDVGERDDRADLLALAGELEAGDVALDAVVVGGEGAGLGQLDGAVLADEATAGARGGGADDEGGAGGQHGGGEYDGPDGWWAWRAPRQADALYDAPRCAAGSRCPVPAVSGCAGTRGRRRWWPGRASAS